MGQRTAIVLQHINKYPCKWGRQEERKTRIFYHQWGIGRVLPSQLLSILYGTLSTSPATSYFARYSVPTGCRDITDEYDGQEILNEVDFNNPKAVGEIIKRADNNNGGLFVRITETEDNKTVIEYAYMSAKDYTTYCTFEQWCADNYGKEYIDKAFLKIYTSTLEYFNAKEQKQQ